VPDDIITVGKTGNGFRSIQDALNTVAAGKSAVTVEAAPGVYREKLVWASARPLCIRGTGGKNTDVRIEFENCESFRSGSENRSLFHIKHEYAQVTLENLTIENTHVKLDAEQNQAEAVYFNSPHGTLAAKNVRFISRQDTLQLKGVCRFYRCYVQGDVDFIWGYVDTALFEDCEINARADNRGTDRTAFVLQSRARANKKGFVFLNCDFTAESSRDDGTVYFARTNCKKPGISTDNWDSIALVNCRIDTAKYHEAGWYDEAPDKIYPPKGTADTGWREYGSTDTQGSRIDLTARHPAAYCMTDAEGMRYADRMYIFAGTALGK
jgi:pectinesterase